MNPIGKISVRFFLNKNVKPSHIPLLGDLEFYPLYIQVTFRRKNTQFRSLYQKEYMDIADAFNRDRKNLIYEENIIKQVVEFEVRTNKEKFQLKGLMDRYRYYTNELGFMVEVFLRDTMSRSLERSKSKYKLIMDPDRHWEVPLKIYYEASLKLITNFEALIPKNFKRDMLAGEEFIGWSKKKKEEESPRLIEWLNETTQKEYKIFLQNKANSDSQISYKINLINRAIAYNEDEMF